MGKPGIYAVVMLFVMFLSPIRANSHGENHLQADTRDWDDEFEGTPTLRWLDDNNFEHDTQAATGQTTGLWLVLFWSHHSAACRDAESALHQVITQTKDVIVAGVNVSTNPRTVKRFNVDQVPHLILFRDRHMYTYNGHWAGMNIIKFVKGGWQSVPVEKVPKEITYLDELLETPLLYYRAFVTYFGNRPGILVGVGSTLSMVGYLCTRRLLLRKQQEKTPRGRPQKRSD